MPWSETCAMDERMRFVVAAGKGYAVMSAVCAEFGISRATAHKWPARYRPEGVEGLKEHSRAPACHGRATTLGSRLRWRCASGIPLGPKKLRRKFVERFPETPAPAGRGRGDEGGEWLVRYAHLEFGDIDQSSGRLRRRKLPKPPRRLWSCGRRVALPTRSTGSAETTATDTEVTKTVNRVSGPMCQPSFPVAHAFVEGRKRSIPDARPIGGTGSSTPPPPPGDQRGDQRRPSGLVRGAEAFAGVPVEILVEQQALRPGGARLE